MKSNQIELSDVMCRIQQAQVVLTACLETMTTDDGRVPDMVDSVLTILNRLPDAIAQQMEEK